MTLAEVWVHLQAAERKLSQIADGIESPRKKLFRAQVRNAAYETYKVQLLVEEAMADES